MKFFKKALALVLVMAMTLVCTACTLPTATGTNNAANTNNAYSKTQIDTLISNLQSTLTALIDGNSSSITQLELELAEKLEELEAEDKSASKALAAAKKDYEGKIAALEAKITECESAKTEIKNDYTAKIAELVAADADNAEALEALKADYDAKIAELEAKITECECEKDEAAVDYSAKIAELEAIGAANAAAIEALKAEYEAKIAEIEAKIEAGNAPEGDGNEGNEPEGDGNETEDYNAKLAELEAKYDAELAALVAKDTENTQAIAALRAEYEAKIAEINAKITALENKEDQVGEDYSEQIAALQTGVSTNAAAIAALRAEYEAKIAELDAKITECECEKENAGVDYTSVIEALEAEVAEVKAKIATLESTYGARLTALEQNSSALTEIDATLSEAGKAADAKAVGDAISELSSSIALLSGLLESKPVYGYVYTTVDTTSEEAAARSGYYLGTNGKAQANSTYAYTQKVDVLPGDVVHLTGYYPDNPTNALNYANKYSMRMACVYDAEGNAVSSLGFSVGSGLMEYEIGAGGAQISVTYTMGSFKNGFVPVVARYTSVGETFVLSDASNSASVIAALATLETLKTDVEALKTDVSALDADKIQELSDNIVTLNAKIDALDVDKLNEAIESIKNLDTNGMNIMVNAALGSSSIVATADKLESGASIQLENNTIINNKNLTFTCDIPTDGIGEGTIRLGHGKTSYGASYIEITATQLLVYNYSSGPSLLATFDHGLTLSDYVTVSIDADYHWAEFKIATATGYYTNAKNWQGRNGAIFAEADGCELTNVSMRWFSEEYQNPIWMVGDSYFNSKDGSRWTSYLVSTGYKNFLMMSYPGMASERGLTEVKQALEHGTPQYIIWCMGMNNGDSIANQTINEAYLAATEEFLEICEEKGITPILSTIPSTPTVLNEYKNAWVREWARTTGGRYIDFSRAVSNETYDASLIGTAVTNTSTTSEKTNKTGYQWYANMLHGDAVHPGTLGAQALFMQFLADFPEIMREK